ncbi:MAG: MFS transporter [Chloroflexota bacterium]|nr:MFS transporter [Dehalococcoidia bacterium]MDW8252331.1 MFS transporter [Chloroflexota bacterium]
MTIRAAPASASTPRRTGFSALRHRNYRLLWSGMLATSTTMWMEQLAYGWLVLELTNSPFLLGFVSFCRTVPTILFSIWGGVLADRLDRKRLLLLCQTLTWATITALALLTTLRLVEVWHVFLAAFLAGTAQSFNLPTRQSIINDAVGKEDLPNAIALNSLSFNVSKVIGPSIAGIIVGAAGTAAVFWTESAIMLFALVTTLFLALPPRPFEPSDQSPLRDLADGFRYVRHDALILGLLLAAAAPVLLAWPYQMLLPVLARDAIGTGPEGLGILMSASGIGAIVTISLMVFLGQRGQRQRVQFVAMVAFGVFLMLFSQSTHLWLSVIIIAFITGSSILYNILNQTALQTSVPDRIRGRVMGIYMLVMGLNPLGALLFGALADAVGVQPTVLLMGALTVLAAVLLFWWHPALRRAEA